MIAQSSIYKSQHASTKLHTIPASTMNSTRPVAVSHGPVYEEPDQTSHSIRLVVLPLIFVVGFFGNTLSASLFLGKTLRMKSCSIYLATKTISDNGFLLSLFVAWLDFVDVRIFHTQVVCHVAVFISYVCGFVSVWSVVMVTVDNYIRICRPSEVSSLCTPYIAWRLTVFGVVFACMLYNYPLWTLGVSTSNLILIYERFLFIAKVYINCSIANDSKLERNQDSDDEWHFFRFCVITWTWDLKLQNTFCTYE